MTRTALLPALLFSLSSLLVACGGEDQATRPRPSPSP